MDNAEVFEVGEVEDKFPLQLGQRIVRFRLQRGLTQAELALRLGVERSRLGKWERGLHSPLSKQIVALAQELKVSTDELLAGEAPTDSSGRPLASTDRNKLADVVATLKKML
jgi:transcriptional regulator with XRE-family HTH domain